MYSLNNLAASSAFAIKVFILVSDYDRAYEIVNDFISKCERKEPEEDAAAKTEAESGAKKAVGAVTTGFFFIPMPDGSEEKAMGITILPKA